MLPDIASQKFESMVLPGVGSPCFQAIAAGMIESRETVGTMNVKVERMHSPDLCACTVCLGAIPSFSSVGDVILSVSIKALEDWQVYLTTMFSSLLEPDLALGLTPKLCTSMPKSRENPCRVPEASF
jgi:hypothetical protein